MTPAALLPGFTWYGNRFHPRQNYRFPYYITPVSILSIPAASLTSLISTFAVVFKGKITASWNAICRVEQPKIPRFLILILSEHPFYKAIALNYMGRPHDNPGDFLKIQEAVEKAGGQTEMGLGCNERPQMVL